MQKTFVLGVGAQKSGTTWLHGYLRERPDSAMGFMKEYHVWDAIHSPDCALFRHQAEKQTIQLIRKGYDAWSGQAVVKRLAFMSDPALYFAYFADLLRQPGVAVTGDITPSYCDLPADVLRRIRDDFAGRGIVVRPVFLMRDPVMRLNSLARMMLKNKKVQPSHDEEIAQMAKLCGRDDDFRSDYRKTVETLEAAFGTDVFFGFYEELFAPGTIAALCAFLGIDFLEADYGKKVNVSKTDNRLSDEDIQRFARHYADQYAFCAERFGRERLTTLWTFPEVA